MAMSRRITRSMSASMKNSTASPGNNSGNFYAHNNNLILGNMLDHEKMERQLISAFTRSAKIPIPPVDILEDDDYFQLYPVVFNSIPLRLITCDEKGNVNQNNEPVPVKSLGTSGHLPEAVVRVEKINLGKILGENNTTGSDPGKFKILKDNKKVVTLKVNGLNGSNGILRLSKSPDKTKFPNI